MTQYETNKPSSADSGESVVSTVAESVSEQLQIWDQDILAGWGSIAVSGTEESSSVERARKLIGEN